MFQKEFLFSPISFYLCSQIAVVQCKQHSGSRGRVVHQVGGYKHVQLWNLNSIFLSFFHSSFFVACRLSTWADFHSCMCIVYLHILFAFGCRVERFTRAEHIHKYTYGKVLAVQLKFSIKYKKRCTEPVCESYTNTIDIRKNCFWCAQSTKKQL